MVQARYAVKARGAGGWDEADHPRDGRGRFARKPGGDGPGKPDGGAPSPTSARPPLPRRRGGPAPTPAAPGRRAKVGDLIPTVDKADVTSRELADIHQKLRAVVEGEFAGFRTRLASLDLDRDFVTFTMDITHEGRVVGDAERNLQRLSDGTLEVEHALLMLSPQARGRGFASAFNAHMEQWYRESGVQRISLHTVSALEGGGYAWAAAGYDWAREVGEELSGARQVVDRLRDKLDDLDEEIAELQDTLDALPDDYRHRDRLQRRLDRLQMAADDAGELLARADHHEFDEPGFPTPYEISQLGRMPGQKDSDDPDEWWLGKRVMTGAAWWAEKRLDGGGQPGGKAAKPAAGAARAAMLRDMAAVHDQWAAEHDDDPAAADDPGAYEEFDRRVRAVLDRHRGEEDETVMVAPGPGTCCCGRRRCRSV